jgi:carbon-monoxide dehydrogenase large subunit
MDAKTADSHGAFHGRVEDDMLLRGTGRFMADAPLPGQAYACFVRSPHACADLKSVDTTAALAIKGVVAVITAADIKAENVGNLSQHPPVAGRGGAKLIMPVRPALAGDKVRHIGEAVAMVLGETLAAAQDGADAVVVDYEPREAVADLRAAIEPGAPQVHPEAPGNIAVDWAGLAPNPDEMAAKVDAALKSAAHVARISLVHQRINVASMEPRGGTASYDAANGSYLLRV